MGDYDAGANLDTPIPKTAPDIARRAAVAHAAAADTTDLRTAPRSGRPQRTGDAVIAAIDFDGTLVEHMYPHIGAEVPGAFDWLRRLRAAGVDLMLWTMRDGDTLAEAVTYCAERGITFWGVNENPGQASWSQSSKQFAHIYIDDAAAGCPLTLRPNGRRPMVDWDAVGPIAWETLGLPDAR